MMEEEFLPINGDVVEGHPPLLHPCDELVEITPIIAVEPSIITTINVDVVVEPDAFLVEVVLVDVLWG